MAMRAEGSGCEKEGQLWVDEIRRGRTTCVQASSEDNRPYICTQQYVIFLELGEKADERTERQRDKGREKQGTQSS